MIGGQDTEEGSWPYLVHAGKSWGYACTGSLISPHAVLTAGHCLYTKGDVTWEPIEWVELKQFGPTVLMELAPEDNVPHPSYVPQFFFFDVAILFLPEPEYSISPVVMNEDPSIPADGELLSVAGWGDVTPDEEDVLYPATPREISQTYITNEACSTPPYEWNATDITDEMLCTTAPASATGQFTGIGDSGENLQCCFHLCICTATHIAFPFFTRCPSHNEQ